MLTFVWLDCGVTVVAEDIAEEIVWVALRPAHVQVAELFVFPTCQASPTIVHRG